MTKRKRSKRWVWTKIGTGYAEVKLLSWKYFTNFVHQEMLGYEAYIWRGQRCDNWTLDSTLDRHLTKIKIAKTKQYQFRNNHLEQFKYSARGRRGSNPALIETENEWWALGQHHGLATPLLDWTASPFVAAYFSFISQGNEQTRYRAVYALHKPTVESKVTEIKNAKEAEHKAEKEDIASGKKKAGILKRIMLDAPVKPEVEFIKPLSDENQRLVNQGGLFSRAPNGIPLDQWVQENDDDNGYTLIKILIPNKERKACLTMLNRMNINHLTLFPDLYGASKFCNLFGEIDKY